MTLYQGQQSITLDYTMALRCSTIVQYKQNSEIPQLIKEPGPPPILRICSHNKNLMQTTNKCVFETSAKNLMKASPFQLVHCLKTFLVTTKMTVSYMHKVGTASNPCFTTSVLFRWHGGLLQAIYPQLFFYFPAYIILALIYMSILQKYENLTYYRW